MAKKKEITIRSSAAEYLTFISAVGDQPGSVELRYQDENIWLTQRLMAELYGVDIPTINYHIQQIYKDNELTEGATIRNFLIVQTEGTRQVSREVKHYSLQMIIAVGFKINNERAVQFRKWANAIVKDIAKNYLTEDELQALGRIVSAYLDLAEVQAMRHIPMTMADWEQRLNGFLELWDRNILQDSGRISAELPKLKPRLSLKNTELCKINCICQTLTIS